MKISYIIQSSPNGSTDWSPVPELEFENHFEANEQYFKILSGELEVDTKDNYFRVISQLQGE